MDCHLARFFPAADVTRLFASLANALEPKTRSNYGAGLLPFTQYCDARGVSEAARMPAEESLLGLFVAQYVGVRRPSCINNWLAGLAFWHTVNLAPWKEDRFIKSLRQAAVRLAPSRTARRPPMTVEHLRALRQGLDLRDAFDASVWAVACTAFWGCRRLGELVVPSRSGFDASRHVARSVAIETRELANGVRALSFRLPWTKTTRAEGALVSLTEPDTLTSPVRAMQHHIRTNSAVPASAPLFAWATAEGRWEPMTRAWFLARCNEIWASVGLEALTGHCFRIGGTRELLLAGVDPDVVAMLGSFTRIPGLLEKSGIDYTREVAGCQEVDQKVC